MVIIYNPYYDLDVCYGDSDIVLGRIAAGNNGLLRELELRTGLTSAENQDGKRLIEYAEAIKKCISSSQGEELFFIQSFKNDELSTAREILRWRDNLVLAGWNQDYSIPEVSEGTRIKMEGLARIETRFNCPGIADRWQAVLEYVKSNPLDNVSIVIDIRRDLVTPVINAVFNSIENLRPGTVSVSEDVQKLTKDSSIHCENISAYVFDTQIDAYQYGLTCTDQGENSLIIADDAPCLNSVLVSLEMQPVGGKTSGDIPLSEQILKSGISLFRNPVSFTDLRNYLSLPVHPLNDVSAGLAKKLLTHLSKTNGFGENEITKETWDSLIAANPGAEKYICMWKNTAGDAIKGSLAIDYCSDIAIWARNKDCRNDVALRTHLDRLAEICENTSGWIGYNLDKSGHIDIDKLERAVSSLTSPHCSFVESARKGCRPIVNDIRCIAGPVGSAIWMDCFNRKPSPYKYDFLNPADIRKIKDLLIESPTLEGEAGIFATLLGVSRCGRLSILIPKRSSGGEKTEKHTFLYYLDQAKGKEDYIGGRRIDISHTEIVNKTAANTQQAEYIISPIQYTRATESFSSLSKLIQEPFDYVLDYILGFKSSRETNLENIKGSVAHDFIKKIVLKAKADDPEKLIQASTFEKIYNDGKDAILESSIKDTGAVLLEKSNEIELKTFKNILFSRSIPNLIAIIKDNGLQIHYCEKQYISNLGGGLDLDARIDMILTSRTGDNYIFDFKWTSSPDHREEEIANNRELQLVLYQKTVENKNKLGAVALKGYYLLKQGYLATSDTCLKENNDIVHVIAKKDCTVDIFDQAINTISARKDALFNRADNAIVEEGDDMKADVMQYTDLMQKIFNDITAKETSESSYFAIDGINCKWVKTKSQAKMTGAKKDHSYGQNVILKGKTK